jgi:hypothetical protein
MSAPLIPSPLDHIGRRPFSFFPPIKNAEPNEWMLASVSWSEIKVVNARTGREIWMPRRYIDAVSYTGGPMLAVTLTKELEYRAGALWPRVKRVIEMPRASDQLPASNPLPTRFSGPAPVEGIRVEDRADSPTNKALAYAGVGAIVVSILAALLSALARL